MKYSLKKGIERYTLLPVQIRASMWFVFSSFFQKGISFITTPIFTRLLTTEEYGKYSVFNSWLSILTVFLTLNLSAGIYNQGLVKFEKNRDEFASSMYGISTFLITVWLLIYLFFNKFWNELFALTTVQMLAMILIIWSSAIFSFWSMQQRVDFKYRRLVFITIIISILKPVLSVALVINAENKVTAYILGTLIVQLMIYPYFFGAQLRKNKKFYSSFFWKYALKLGIPLVPHYLSLSVLAGADRIMISEMEGIDEAGIYNLAYTVSQIVSVINTSLLQTIEPWLYKKIKMKKVEEISVVAYPSFVFSAILSLMVIMLAPEIIIFFAPSGYYKAIWVIPPVAMSSFFTFIYTFFVSFEFYYEKTKGIALATISGAIINVLLNYIFIKIFGYYAAGYTTLLCYMIFAVLHYWFMSQICKKYLNLSGSNIYDLSKLVKIVICFMSVGFLLMITYENRVIKYISILLFILFLMIKKKKAISFARNLINLRENIK